MGNDLELKFLATNFVTLRKDLNRWSPLTIYTVRWYMLL